MKRYYCGNGEGMFDSKDGHWVMYDDVKQLQEENKKLKEEKQELVKYIDFLIPNIPDKRIREGAVELIKKHKK